MEWAVLVIERQQAVLTLKCGHFRKRLQLCFLRVSGVRQGRLHHKYKFLYNIRHETGIVSGQFAGCVKSVSAISVPQGDFLRGAICMAGLQLDRVQRGLDPDSWKPMATVGAGVREIRVRDAAGAFRVLYVARFEQAVYVLHCFQKKSARTSRSDIEIGQQRYRELVKGLR